MSAWIPLDGLGHSGESRHDEFAGASPEALVTIDPQGVIVMVNDTALRLFGCDEEQALGSNLSRFLPDPAGGSLPTTSSTAAALRPRLPGEREVITGVRLNGKRFQAEISVSKVSAAPGLGGGGCFTVMLRDPRERQGVKAELEALQRRIRAIFELAPVAIWITEGDHIVFVNRACLKLLGVNQPDNLLGRSIFSLLSAEAQGPVRDQMEQALATGGQAAVAREHIACLDGSLREVEIAIAALPDLGRTALQMVITDVTLRQQESADLESSRLALQRLSASLVETREEERRRIARELHDELGQQLSALKMDVASLKAAPHSPLQSDRFQSMLEMIDETVASVRRIAADLRPLMLDDLGLNAAVEWLARMSSRRMGLQIALRLGSYPEPIAERASIALYRMVQEALTNIARHAQATEALIEIQQVGEELRLTVEDNGVGLRPQSMHRVGSHGLMGMRERCHMLGGTLEIGQSSSGGGRIAVRLPLRAGAAGAVPARRAGEERSTRAAGRRLQDGNGPVPESEGG